MDEALPVDPEVLREEVKSKYRDVALKPGGQYHFHTGRRLAAHLGYDRAIVDPLPDAAVESFAGVANPFALRSLERGERVVDAGSGGGFDCFIAASQTGPEGRVGLLEGMPVEDGWADVVISNGVINLCADKRAVFSEIWRVLRPGGRVQFGDIANGKPVPESAVRDVDLWTA
jgi:SAM-dependent methyltransferase